MKLTFFYFVKCIIKINSFYDIYLLLYFQIEQKWLFKTGSSLQLVFKRRKTSNIHRFSRNVFQSRKLLQLLLTWRKTKPKMFSRLHLMEYLAPMDTMKSYKYGYKEMKSYTSSWWSFQCCLIFLSQSLTTPLIYDSILFFFSRTALLRWTTLKNIFIKI